MTSVLGQYDESLQAILHSKFAFLYMGDQTNDIPYHQIREDDARHEKQHVTKNEAEGRLGVQCTTLCSTFVSLIAYIKPPEEAHTDV